MSSVERQIQDVLEAVNAYASHTDGEFADVRAEMRNGFAEMRTEMRNGFAEMRSEFANLRQEVVTKNYLEERLAMFRRDLAL